MIDLSMNIQNHLINIKNWIISDLKSDKIRAVDAVWKEKENTASLPFYINEETTEEDFKESPSFVMRGRFFS